MVISYFGAEATGKTTLGFSAIKSFPDGIMIHFDFDLGRERAIWRFPDSLANRIKTVKFPEVASWTLGSGAITKRWSDFERTYEMALNDPQVRVLFIDTASQMNTLNADEYLENYVKRNRPNRHQLSQIEYRVPNTRTRAKYMAAREAEKLLIISHKEAPVYVEQFVQQADGSMKKESVNTGQKTFGGLGETPYLADQHLQLYLKNGNVDLVTGKELLPISLVTVAKFLKPNPPMIYGMELPQPNFERVIQMVDGVKKMCMEVE
uniref:Uncharacterized protein n=1 Tax=viral metagenome TaxID=1070528 RepID=A0A6M3J6H5_9ZZZZ